MPGKFSTTGPYPRSFRRLGLTYHAEPVSRWIAKNQSSVRKSAWSVLHWRIHSQLGCTQPTWWKSFKSSMVLTMFSSSYPLVQDTVECCYQRPRERKHLVEGCRTNHADEAWGLRQVLAVTSPDHGHWRLYPLTKFREITWCFNDVHGQNVGASLAANPTSCPSMRFQVPVRRSETWGFGAGIPDFSVDIWDSKSVIWRSFLILMMLMPQIHPQKSREIYISWNQPDSARVLQRTKPTNFSACFEAYRWTSSIQLFDWAQEKNVEADDWNSLSHLFFIRSQLQNVHTQTESIYIYISASNEIYTSFMKNKFIEIHRHTEYLFKTRSQKLVNLVHQFFSCFTMLHYMQLPEVDTISGNALLAACRNARRWCEARMKRSTCWSCWNKAEGF